MKKLFYILLLCSFANLQAERSLGITSLTQELPNTKLVVKGEVPNWLDGTLVRNGPALFNVGDKYLRHWFDGLAMLHAFSFSKGEVIYRNKFLHTTPYHKMVVDKSLDFPGFGQAGAKTEANFIPNANINIAKFANDLVALTEVPQPVIFDLATLKTVGLFSYKDTLPKARVWECAHPHTDPVTGEVINYLVQFYPTTQYVIYKMKKGSHQRETLAEIPVQEPSYMHSFALSQNYVILVEFPLVSSPEDFAKEGSFQSHYRWKDTKQMRILLISRKTGDIAGEYFGESSFAWHHINSFEQDDTIFIDMAAYQDADTFFLDGEGEDPEHKRMGRFVRYKIKPSTKAVIKEAVGPAIEMPRINYDSNNSKPYNYVYGYDDSHILNGLKTRGLVKIDSKTKDAKHWSEQFCIADEPIFVAKPNATQEDDGVILAVVLNIKKEKSFLLILDAKQFTELARAEVPHHIPYELHGQYIQR